MSNNKKQPTDKPKRGRGRPRTYVMPEPIPDTPENIAKAILARPPKKQWDFEKPGSGAKVE